MAFAFALITALTLSIETTYSSPYYFDKYINESYYQIKDTIDYLVPPGCPLVTDILSSAKAVLPRSIRGQNEALDHIYNAIASWEFQNQVDDTEPLVLAITGPTGVGKSETAFRIAESIFKRRVRVGKSSKLVPKGLLVIRGEDFSLSSQALTGSIGKAQKLLKKKIVAHILSCEGNAMVVFDEIQKAAPGVLEFLVPALDDRGAFSYNEEDMAQDTTQDGSFLNSITSYATSLLGSKAQEGSVSTSNSIFVFISDIGSELMTKLLLSYGSRTKVPQNILRNEVKALIDEQSQRLRLGRMVKEVIPFMPLEAAHIKEILALKIENLAESKRFTHWVDIAVNDDVLSYLVSPRFIKYSVYSSKQKPPSTAANETGRSAVSATNAGLENSGSRMIFSTWGARALENAGPLLDLRSLLFRYLQPWRANEIVHIALLGEHNAELQRKKWGAAVGVAAEDGQETRHIVLQWCAVDKSMLASERSDGSPDNCCESNADDNDSTCGTADSAETCGLNGVDLLDSLSFNLLNGEANLLNITDEIAFSHLCETIWYGPFPTA